MASPWKKVDPVDTCNLQEIMSEEFARGLQDKENKKYENQLLKSSENQSTDATFASQLKKDSAPTISVASEPSGSKDPSFDRQNQLEDIPEDVLNFIRNDSELSQSVDFCDSDRMLAELLQASFDKEHDDEVNRIEKHANKNSKVTVSFLNYRRQHPAAAASDDSDEYDDGDEQPKNWDRFDANEKMYRNLNKKGFGHDEDGVIITKHDAEMCGVRNACRVMSFPPEFSTGDAGGFDMKLSNQVFNQLRTYSQKIKKNKAHDRRDTKVTAEMGIDEPTRLRLYKLINNQILEQVNGIISTGKEAVILHANSDPSYAGELILPKECAIKIFKTTLNDFKQRDRYIKGN